jgi:hypothetical protein
LCDFIFPPHLLQSNNLPVTGFSNNFTKQLKLNYSLHDTLHPYVTVALVSCKVFPVSNSYFLRMTRFYISKQIQHISALFWDFTKRRMMTSQWGFGTNYRSYFQVASRSWNLEEWSLRLSWNVVKNYHSTLRKIPK